MLDMVKWHGQISLLQSDLKMAKEIVNIVANNLSE